MVGSCETADDLLLKVRSYSPDVAIVDIRLPPTHNDEGLRAALEIRAHHPSVGVLVLSQYVEVGLAMKLLADSAEGRCLLKDRIGDVKEFIGAVRRVADGGSAIDPIIVSTLLSKRRSDDPLDELTPREREVLELMAEGRSNQNRRQARDHASRRRGSTSPPSSGSSAHSAVATRVEFWPFCSSCAPESRAPQDAETRPRSPSLPSSAGWSSCEVGWTAHGREERREVPCHPGRAGRVDSQGASRRSGARQPAESRCRMALWSAHHRKKAILGWLAAVVLFAVSFVSPLEKIVTETSGPGESGRADAILYEDFEQPAGESVLIESTSLTADDPAFRAVVMAAVAGLSPLDAVAKVESPYDAGNGGQISADRHSVLVPVEIGPSAEAGDKIDRSRPGWRSCRRQTRDSTSDRSARAPRSRSWARSRTTSRRPGSTRSR